MTVLTFPTLSRAPSASRWGLVAQTQTFVSPFTGAAQTLSRPGDRWAATLEFASLSYADWRLLGQFVAQLRGQAGRFTFSPTWVAPRSALTVGTPLVNGASQTGSTLAIDGATLSATIASKGDFFSFNDTSSRKRLHMLTADATTNGSGQVTLAIAPPLRSSPADNAALDFSTPGAVFMLTSDDGGQFAFDGARPDHAGGFRAAVSLDIVEALL